MNLIDTVIDYIQNNLLDEGMSVERNDNLLETGLIDSMGLMRLIAFLEDTYNIKIPPIDIVLSNFRDVLAIEKYIQLK